MAKKIKLDAKKVERALGKHWEEALTGLDQEMAEFCQNLLEIKRLKKEGSKIPESNRRLDQLQKRNNHFASQAAENLHEAFYQETKDPNAFLSFVAEMVEALESTYDIRMKMSEEKLQEVVNGLSPGMKVITEEDYKAAFK
jgi:hypothetical protein